MNLIDLTSEKEFTILEISKLFRLSKTTIFNWIKRGLVYRFKRSYFITGKNVGLYLNQFNEKS